MSEDSTGIRLNGSKLALVGAFFSILGAFLPWVSYPTSIVYGIPRSYEVMTGIGLLMDGKVTLVLAIIIIGVSFLNEKRLVTVFLASLGVSIILIGLIEITTFSNYFQTILGLGTAQGFTWRIGYGLILTIIGGFIALLGALVTHKEKSIILHVRSAEPSTGKSE
jgi:hypothetical protein